jgi:hypothetical protein
MTTRVIREAILIALATLTLTGCGRQAAEDPSGDLDLLATGPDQAALPVPRPWVSAALDATGGLATWMQSKRLDFDAVVTAYREDGSFYLTEQHFSVCPWSGALQVSAREPGSEFTCRIVDGQYNLLKGDSNSDVSPLSAEYRDFAEAVLQIATTPIRMLRDNVVLLHRPAPVMLAGQWYIPIEAKYGVSKPTAGEESKQKEVAEPCWKEGTYFQNQATSLVDMIWLGDPARQKFVVVRGYDYNRTTRDGVVIPTKIEICQSDPDANVRQRVAVIDLKQ